MSEGAATLWRFALRLRWVSVAFDPDDVKFLIWIRMQRKRKTRACSIFFAFLHRNLAARYGADMQIFIIKSLYGFLLKRKRMPTNYFKS